MVSILLLVLVLVLVLMIMMKGFGVMANNQCFSCSGECHSELYCNCQMGACSSHFCYTERRPTEMPGVFRIMKGCMRRPPRTTIGCDYDTFKDRVLCICNGDFCNNAIELRSFLRRGVTCRQCGERDPDCSNKCHGHWCFEETMGGSAGCGFGVPALPFFYRGPELLASRPRLCITLSRGMGKPRRHCICNTEMCNAVQKNLRMNQMDGSGATRPRSVLVYSGIDELQPVQRCVSCELNNRDESVTASCKQNYCTGHFCSYSISRSIGGHIIGQRLDSSRISERQGCINVSDTRQMQLGCTHKWMTDSEEEINCACHGDNCNRDLDTASRSRAIERLPSSVFFLFLCLFVLTHTATRCKS